VGSEFTIKVAAIQGDSAKIAPRPNVELWDSVVVVVVVTGGMLPPF
jgi:hypothetical protein